MAATKATPRVVLTPTKEGKLWKRRHARAETRRKRALADMPDLWRLYTTVYEQRQRWGVSIPLARTLVDSLVADTYIQNPEAYIELRNGPGADLDAPHKVRDLLKAIHEGADTEKIMKRGTTVCAYAGIAGHWADFEQEQEFQHIPVTNDFGDPLTDSGGEPLVEHDGRGRKSKLVAKSQRCTGQLLMPTEFLVDPDENDWELKSAKWIAVERSKTIEEFEQMVDPTDGTPIVSAANLAKLRSWVASQPLRKRAGSDGLLGYGSDEKDERYRPIFYWTTWSRVEKMIYLQPSGADFHFAEFEWPEAWAQANEYPLTIIGYRWQPPDENGNGGFYGCPDLRLPRSPLENLPRLEAVYLDSATNTIKKYLSVAGLTGEPEKNAIQSDVNRQWIDLDLKEFAKKYNNGQPIDISVFDMKRFIMSLGENDRSEALQQLEALNHEMEMAFTLMGVGPANRAGIAPGTGGGATESLGIQQRLATHTEQRVEEGAKIADRITKKYIIILKGCATLPIPYQRSIGIDQSTWDSFLPEDLWDLDIAVKHHIGSSLPPDRATIKAERRELFGLVAPVLQSLGAVQQVFQWLSWLTEPYDSQFAAQMLRPELNDIASQMALMMNQFKDGVLQVSDQQAIGKLVGLLGTFLGKYLSPAQLQKVAQEAVASVGSQAPAPAQGGTGSMPKAPTQGGAAAVRGSAAAGAIGGMSPS
jgi:hypothetical protein